MAAHGRATVTILWSDDPLIGERLAAGSRGVHVDVEGSAAVVAFDVASDALEAALECATPAARIGLAAGEVRWDGSRCIGPCLGVAASLMTAAERGEILASGLVQLLVGGGDERFRRVGQDPDAGDVFAVVRRSAVEGSAPLAPPELALPRALDARVAHRFVGRASALGVLHEAWRSAGRGPGTIALVGGEAGAGKTRLASELARSLATGDVCVLYGGCDEDLAVPYQPWVHAADQLMTMLPSSALTLELAAQLVPLAPLLARVERLVGGAPRVGLDADADRFRTYTAFSALLVEACRHWPTLLVLDDLHWAGTQTLAVLRHLAHAGLPTGALIVGTFRDTADEITEPLAGCLADLRRVDGVRRLRLEGLGTQAVEHFVADAVGRDLDEDLRGLAARLTERTGGNPFYLAELWRHLEDHEPSSTVPESVREVVAVRLSRLSPPARQIVDVAAVAGERFDLRVLERASGLSGDAFDEAVDELLAGGVLAGAAGTAVGGSNQVHFAHAIVRDAVEARIARRALAGLHLALAEAIEEEHAADRRPVLVSLARHYAAAGGPQEKIAYFGRRAAATAIRAAAYEEAIVHLEAVIEAGLPPIENAEVLLELASAQLRCGSFGASRDSSERAFHLAVAGNHAPIAGRAAIGCEEAIHFPGLPGDHAIPMLRQALEMLGDRPSAVHTRVLASLGRALAFTGQVEGIVVGEAALAEARASGDLSSLAVALQSLSVSINEPERVLAISNELDDLGQRLGDPWSMSYATGNKLRAMITLGQLDGAGALVSRHLASSATRRFATFEFMGHVFGVVLALAAGDLPAAEAAAERAAAKGAADGAPFDAGVYGLQMYAIRRAQGRLAEVAPMLRAVTGMADPPPMWRPGLAAIYAELGMLDEAAEVFDRLAPNDFAAVPRDAVWPACLTFLAETCIVLGDTERAPVLAAALATHRRRNLMAGMTICFGPADRLLGGLAALCGRRVEAEAHFADALALAEASGSPLWTAEVQYDFARFLASGGQRERAAVLGRAAISTARQLGIGRLADRPVPGEPDPDGRSEAARADQLSEREIEVLALAAAGRSNREIGQRLFISPNTVANHMRAILRKTGSANRAEAASYATRKGLTHPTSPGS